MTDIVYYPVVDCNTEGTVKTALLASLNGTAIKANSRMWLVEMVPNYFRLYAACDYHTTDLFAIRCPRCGKDLKRIGLPVDNKHLGLYECRACAKK